MQLEILAAPLPLVPGDNAALGQLKAELAEYFCGRRRCSVPLEVKGSPFQNLCGRSSQIPYGETRSYEEIARRVGSPAGVRAVGQANGMNRIAIVLPCHRVVNKSGKLGGYGGGLWRKERLLALERGQPIQGLLVP
jgi:AraC family transcriptional regulator of adaptative response/methylated-DNA-[protein]-cysteine methyltransferase